MFLQNIEETCYTVENKLIFTEYWTQRQNFRKKQKNNVMLLKKNLFFQKVQHKV